MEDKAGSNGVDVDRIIRIVDGSGETPSPHELEVISRMAEISTCEEYDQRGQFERLQKTIFRQRQKKRHTVLLRFVSSAAALLVLGLVLLQLYKEKSHAPTDVEQSNPIIIAEARSETKDVLLKLRNGLVINATEEFQDASTTDDLKSIERNHPDLVALGEYNTIVVPRTKEYKLLLEDGSQVTFNSDTQVRFPNEFSSLERRIILDYGEIFLQVAKDENRPFIVEVAGSVIEVLGTSFNINAYPESPLSTTLVTGKARMSKGEKSVEMTPGMQVTVIGDDHLEVSNADIQGVLAWTKGKYKFENRPLKEIITQLERWYDCQVVYDESKLSTLAFTGLVSKEEGLDHILGLLTKTGGVEFYHSDSETIHVRAKQRED